MLLETRTFEPAHFSSPLAIQAFSMSDGPILFDLLSNKLYVYKEKAAIREVCCNAADANVEAGNGHRPILIHLPTETEPYFSVQDRGPGLSEVDALDLYTTYGASTKRRDVLATGGLGLGTKSPLAYLMTFTKTPNFHVTTVKDGIRCVLSYAMNEQGIPMAYLMDKQEGVDAPDGVNVQFEVNMKDVSRFNYALADALQWFTVPVEYTNPDAQPFIPHKVIDRLGALTVLERSFYNHFDETNVYAVMSNVAYPISMNALPEELSALLNLVGSGRTTYLQLEPSSVDFPPSREALEYTPRTIKTLESLVPGIKAELTKRLDVYRELDAEQFTGQLFKDLPWITRVFTATSMARFCHDYRKTLTKSDSDVRLDELITNDWIQRTRALMGVAGKATIRTNELNATVHNRRDWPKRVPNGNTPYIEVSELGGVSSNGSWFTSKGGTLRVVYLDMTTKHQAGNVSVALAKKLCKGADHLLCLSKPGTHSDANEERAKLVASNFVKTYFGQSTFMRGIKLEFLSDLAPELMPKVAPVKETPALEIGVTWDSATMSFSNETVSTEAHLKEYTHFLVTRGVKVRPQADMAKAYAKYAADNARLHKTLVELTKVIKADKPGSIGKVMVLFTNVKETPSACVARIRGRCREDLKQLLKQKSLLQAYGDAMWKKIYKAFSPAAITVALTDPFTVIFPYSRSDAQAYFETDGQVPLFTELANEMKSGDHFPPEFADPTMSPDSTFFPFMMGALQDKQAAIDAEELKRWLNGHNKSLEGTDLNLSPVGTLQARVEVSVYTRYYLKRKKATPAFFAADDKLMAGLKLNHQWEKGASLRGAMPPDTYLCLLKGLFTLLRYSDDPTPPKGASVIQADLDLLHHRLNKHVATLAITSLEQEACA